jgi:hypothetical protein
MGKLKEYDSKEDGGGDGAEESKIIDVAESAESTETRRPWTTDAVKSAVSRKHPKEFLDDVTNRLSRAASAVSGLFPRASVELGAAQYTNKFQSQSSDPKHSSFMITSPAAPLCEGDSQESEGNGVTSLSTESPRTDKKQPLYGTNGDSSSNIKPSR